MGLPYVFFLYPHKAFNFFICLVIVLIIILIYSVSVFDQLKWARNLFQSRCTSSPTRFTSTTWSKYINVPGKLHFLFRILIKRAFLGKPALKQHHKKFRRLPQRVNSIEAQTNLINDIFLVFLLHYILLHP